MWMGFGGVLHSKYFGMGISTFFHRGFHPRFCRHNSVFQGDLISALLLMRLLSRAFTWEDCLHICSTGIKHTKLCNKWHIFRPHTVYLTIEATDSNDIRADVSTEPPHLHLRFDTLHTHALFCQRFNSLTFMTLFLSLSLSSDGTPSEAMIAVRQVPHRDGSLSTLQDLLFISISLLSGGNP